MQVPANIPGSTRSSGPSIVLRPHSLKELAALYGISDRTFKKWIGPFEKMIGKRIGHYYNIAQVRKIFISIGFPSTLYESGEGL